LTYNLEPAGSHGVWGLDDHVFLPYIFGSAQLSPQVPKDAVSVPQEGSAKGSPKPAAVAVKATVDDWRDLNMYFGAIGFINDVKRGPFWEHSPMLYDISGVKAGWAKINKGMLKMFQVEVLSKFPVVQHFPFGSLFEWELDPNAATQATSVHLDSQPAKPSPPSTQAGTQAPWATGRAPTQTPTTFRPPPSMSNQAATTRMPPPGALPPSGAPWATTSGRAPVPHRPKPSDP
jgi:serine/threonine-protein phosphatase 2A activator